MNYVDIAATDIIQWIAILGVLVTVAIRINKLIYPVWHKLEQMANDFAGEPERPGVPAKPGIMERISKLEQLVAELSDKIDKIDESTKHVR